MKKFLLCIALLTAVSIQAEDLTAQLKMCNGTIQKIILNSSSEIQMQRNVLKVHAPSNIEYDVLFFIDDVASLSFEQPATNVDKLSEPILSYRLDNDFLVISGIPHRGNVSVYNISGLLLHQEKVTETTCKISLATLPKGIILIKVNNQTIKIQKK